VPQFRASSRSDQRSSGLTVSAYQLPARIIWYLLARGIAIAINAAAHHHQSAAAVVAVTDY